MGWILIKAWGFMTGTHIFFSSDLSLTLVTSIEKKCILKPKDTDVYFPEIPVYFNTKDYALHTAAVILNRFILGAVLCSISSKTLL